MELRPIVHLALHVAVPAIVAWFAYPKQRWRAFAWLLAGWLIDVDHLFANPVYAPGRCSLGFHPLHTTAAVLAYVLLLLPRRTRLLAIGLLIHIGLDGIDCLAMRG
jgi:hypothetical protein